MRFPLAAMALVFAVSCGSEQDVSSDGLSSDNAEAASSALVVYDNVLQNGFADWSWGTHSFTATTVHSGTASISFEPDNWAGLFLHRSSTFDVSQYASLTFWVNGGTGSNQAISAALYSGNTVIARVPVAGIKAGAWTQVSIPVTSFTGAGTIDGVALVDMSGGNQAAVYIDDISFQPPAQTKTETVYADALVAGISDWSWGTHSLVATSPVHGGTKSISFTPSSWSAVFLEFDNGIDLTTHTSISFWVYGASRMNFSLVKSGASVSNTAIAGTAGAWKQSTVDLTKLGVTGTVNGFWIADSTGGTQAQVFIDDIVFTTTTTGGGGGGGGTGGSAVTVAVDRAANRRAVNPEIYGVNFGSDAAVRAMKYPVRRFGGNATTRYNFQTNMTNTGSDWFFMNVSQNNADSFIDSTRAAGSQTLMTIPTIGWTPLDTTKRWSYSVAKYGAQQQTECSASGYASWCMADAGNGVRTNGTLITANPADTSKAVGPAFATQQIQHIQSRVGTAAAGGVRYYSLDNEPTLWNNTHRDVHPNGLTYDELWQKTQAYGQAIKAADANAKTFGPAEWGWCGYLDSSGGCGASADKKAHGDLPMLAWYLQKVCSEQATTGVRVVDYLDVHYYPQATNVALSSDESGGTQASRLRSVKSLYDPTYVDESWINTQIQLIPRLHGWIDTYCPGTKIAITEYQFGNDAGISAALAQAEVLAIFAREGVDFATRWIAPDANTLVEDAFKLFLNYDGAGTRVTGTSVKAVSSSVDSVGAYAIEGADGVLRLVLVNHDTAAHSVKVTLAGAHTIELYGFDGSTRLGARGTVTGDGASFTINAGARSATLAVVKN